MESKIFTENYRSLFVCHAFLSSADTIYLYVSKKKRKKYWFIVFFIGDLIDIDKSCRLEGDNPGELVVV